MCSATPDVAARLLLASVSAIREPDFAPQGGGKGERSTARQVGAAETTGGPVLSDALAFLSCKVIQRMETNDHWIIYSLVEKGNLSNTQSKTAVHHRKVGSNY